MFIIVKLLNEIKLFLIYFMARLCPAALLHLSYCAEAFGGRALIINHDFKGCV